MQYLSKGPNLMILQDFIKTFKTNQNHWNHANFEIANFQHYTYRVWNLTTTWLRNEIVWFCMQLYTRVYHTTSAAERFEFSSFFDSNSSWWTTLTYMINGYY